MELGQIVLDFAHGMTAVDGRSPQAASQRDGSRFYQPGIGPFSEDAAVALTLAEMKASSGEHRLPRCGQARLSGQQICLDLAVGERPDWAIEIKLARLGRDNGTYEDAAIKKILSPYPDDRSAVTDCQKLASSSFEGRRAVLIYGFDDPERPLSWLMNAVEAIAGQTVRLGPRQHAPLGHLVHPVFAAGHVYAWEVLG